jgi:hypothetical protein
MRVFPIVFLGICLFASCASAAIMCPTDIIKGCTSFKNPEGDKTNPVRCQDATHCRASLPDANGVCVFTCPVFLRGEKIQRR